MPMETILTAATEWKQSKSLSADVLEEEYLVHKHNEILLSQTKDDIVSFFKTQSERKSSLNETSQAHTDKHYSNLIHSLICSV